jgi:ankyrin repeat protein
VLNGADADCGESDSQRGTTALILAAVNGRADCARLLIDAGADKEAKNNVRVVRCFAWLPSRF